MTRRDFLKSAALAGLAIPVFAGGDDRKPQKKWLGGSSSNVPCRAITRGPKHHWFGYYDKLQFDTTERFVLSNQVDFEHRTPRAADQIAVGMVDLKNGDKWMELGKSRAWGWQQGCMLQWRPGHADREVLWNDRTSRGYVCRIHDIKTKKTRTIDRPIYALSPDGKWAVTADFARIQRMRPGYGYQGISDPNMKNKAPEDSGIWRMNLDTGKSELIVPLARLAAIPFQGKKLNAKWNYVNHLLVNTNGTRFIFLHRWRDDRNGQPTGRFITRMFTANLDGSGLYELDPSGYTSHFIWRDEKSICAWTRPKGKPAAFYLFEDRTRKTEIVGKGVMTRNGHNTYVPGSKGKWILNDTYPTGKNRWQTPYLFHIPTGKRVDLGNFHLPAAYKGEWRCDTHPRSSTNGRYVTIDSPHGGTGRQIWLLDVSKILNM